MSDINDSVLAKAFKNLQIHANRKTKSEINRTVTELQRISNSV